MILKNYSMCRILVRWAKYIHIGVVVDTATYMRSYVLRIFSRIPRHVKTNNWVIVGLYNFITIGGTNTYLYYFNAVPAAGARRFVRCHHWVQVRSNHSMNWLSTRVRYRRPVKGINTCGLYIDVLVSLFCSLYCIIRQYRLTPKHYKVEEIYNKQYGLTVYIP